MIDILVDVTAGQNMMNFLYIFSCYINILMHPDDQENGIYYYKIMTFRLNNAKATY